MSIEEFLIFPGIEAIAKSEGCEMIIEGCTPLIKCAEKSERISMGKIKRCISDNGYHELIVHIKDICNELKTGS